MRTDLETIFAAIAFAEENEHDTALNLLQGERKENFLFKTLGKKLGRFRKVVDKYQQQITFAEAGSFELIDEKPIAEESKQNVLLVVGNEASFSNSIMEYTIEMAKMMSYKILALNAAPFTCNTHNLFSSTQKTLCDDFTKMARENICSFKEKAQENGVEFKHLIMFDNVDKAQENVFKEYKDIAFVISNKIEGRPIEKREGLEDRIFVYSVM